MPQTDAEPSGVRSCSVTSSRCSQLIPSSTPPGASALSAFRAFNYENIYLRDESRDQAHRVVTVLQALVEHLSADPNRLPARLLTDDSEAGVRHAAVRWVAGMTDRYAINCAQDWLGFDAEALPRGIDAPG